MVLPAGSHHSADRRLRFATTAESRIGLLVTVTEAGVKVVAGASLDTAELAMPEPPNDDRDPSAPAAPEPDEPPDKPAPCGPASEGDAGGGMGLVVV